jgi:ankyrin repeat protein
VILVAGVPALAQQYSDSFTFLKAVKERDADKVTSMVAVPGTVVVNSRDRANGDTALHYIVRERDYTWLSFLIGKGAKLDSQNSRGETPLSVAAQLGWAEGADLMLRRGASVDLANSQGETPLILAVHRRDLSLVRLLVAKGANPKRTDRVAGYSALDYAKRDTRALPILKALEAPQEPARAVAGPKL